MPNRSFRKRDLLHFIPLLFFIVNCFPVFIPGHSGPMFSNRFDEAEGGQYIRVFMFLVIKVQIIIYWIVSFVKLIRYQKNMRLVFSSLEPVNLNWLKYFLISLLLVLLLWFNEALLGIKWINDFSSLGYLMAIYLLSYFALKQKEIFPFQSIEAADIHEIINERNHETLKQERISAHRIEPLMDKLKTMKTDRCFLDLDLSLPHLAKMDLTSHELSYLLNQGLGVSFFEFVNRYRVEEAKSLIEEEG